MPIPRPRQYFTAHESPTITDPLPLLVARRFDHEFNPVDCIELYSMLAGRHSRLQHMLARLYSSKRSLFALEHAHQFPIHVSMNVVPSFASEKLEMNGNHIALENLPFFRREDLNARPLRGF